MNEADFKAACDLIREECAKMTSDQIAILVGYVVHDQGKRKAKKEPAATVLK